MELDRKYLRIRSCAKAMDLWPKKDWKSKDFVEAVRNGTFTYNPAINYGEALQLVERYHLTVMRIDHRWSVSPPTTGSHFRYDGLTILDKNICAAITDCTCRLYEQLEEQREQKQKEKKFK